MTQQTSREAYQAVKPFINDSQKKVLATLLTLKKATNEQIAEYLGKTASEISPRTGELERMNLIKRLTTERVKTKSGCAAYPFVAIYKPKQLNFLDDRID